MQGWGGLRSRLVVLVLVALLPVFWLFAYTAAKHQQAALALAQASLQSQALLAATGQRHFIERVRQLLGDIASGPSIKDTRIRLCVPYLKNLQSQDPYFAELGVIDLDGQVSCHAGMGGKDIYVGDRSYFKQVLSGQNFAIGEYAVGRASGRPGIGFGVPVYGGDTTLNGVAFVALDIAAFANALATTPLIEGAQMRVIDRRGIILAVRPAAAAVVGTSEKDAVVLAALRAGRPGGRETAEAGGLERVYAYAPVSDISGEELFVAISVPRAVIMAEPLRLLRIDLAILLAMTAFGVGCAWWAGGRLIVRPANAVLKQAQEVVNGNLAARIPSAFTGRDELGKIAQTFNQMAESLQERRAQLDLALGRIGKEHDQLQLIINSMSEGVIAVDLQGRFLLFNAAARKLFPAVTADTTVERWRQKHALLMLDGDTPYAERDRPLSRAIRGEQVDEWDVLLRRPEERDRILRMNLRPLKDPQEAMVGGLVVFTDITERKATEDFVHAQEQVLELIATGVPLNLSLEAVVRLIEASAPQSLCTILVVEGDQLRHAAAGKMPAAFCQEIDPLPIGAGIGACGTAAFLKQAVTVENTETDPLMQDFREVLHRYGLKACWSTPILSSAGDVMATFAIYYTTPRKPQKQDLALVDTAVRLARIALEKDRAEAALLGSEARFRELAENVEDVFYNRDAASGRMLYVSPAYASLWQRSCESLYADSTSYLQVIHPDDQALALEAEHANQAGQARDIEYRLMRADGEIRWVRDHSYPVMNAAGKLERVVGTARDVTARKLVDLELARINRALQMLGQCNKALTRMEDEPGLLGEVCRLAVEVGGYRMAWVGYARDDEARTIVPMAHAGEEGGYLSQIKLSWRDDRVTGRGPAGQAIRSGQPQQSGDITRADNHFHWHEEAVARGYRSAVFLPLRDGQRSFGLLGLYSAEVQRFAADEVALLQELADNLAFGIGSLRARLERRRGEEEARRASAKLREQASLLDRAQDAIVVRNLDRTIRFWNKGAERLYGWTAEEVMGKTMENVMYRSPEVLIRAMNQTLANNGDWTGELEQVARDGAIINIEARWTVVRDEHHKVYGVLGINTDIRERNRARAEILHLNASLEERVQQRTAQLEFANRQLEAFSYSVSHDLRSPLSAIDGFSDLLERALVKSASGTLAERSQHYLSRIRAGVSQMGELIDAMLALAQVSRSSLRWERVNLSALAEALLARYQEHEPGRAAQWQVEAGMFAQGDPRLLNQVLDNLLGNAWKFSAGMPRTEIRFGRQAGENGEAVYFVQDNGAGFDMAYAEKLFGAFQRLHSLSEFAGTGVGLATVHRIILRHGGRVWAESALGQGATFRFTLGAEKL